MHLTQDFLRAELARRIAEFRPDLAARHDLKGMAGLLAAQRETASRDDVAPTVTCVVVRSFSLLSFIPETCAFAQRLGPAAAADWRRAFTRSIFLAGNPDNLGGRFDFSHLAHDGSAAWLGPVPKAATAGLCRLLKLFDAARELPTGPPVTVEIPLLPGTDCSSGPDLAFGVDPSPGPEPSPGTDTPPGTDARPTGEPIPVRRERVPVRRDLYVTTARVSIADSLVHLGHLLTEAVFDGTLGAGDLVTVRQCPYLLGTPRRFAALRVAGVPGDPGRLRAYAGLSEVLGGV